MTVVIEKAYAKINLGLKILGKRQDGYHNILSLFQTVEVHDTLMISDSEPPSLECGASDVPLGAENLILKAERLFSEFTGINSHAHFLLTKIIPLGGGLGGGSANAAAALRGLRRFYRIESLSENEMMEMAAKLGSDVPFLLSGGTAVVSGRGENILPTDWPFDFTYIIVNPGFAISTAWAYHSLQNLSGNYDNYNEIIGCLQKGKLGKDEFFRSLSNDFESVVLPEYPVLATIKSIMLDQGASAAFMTGSGSSMVGIFEDEQKAYSCSTMMNNRQCTVFTTKKSSPYNE
jgi:4-diphosphocytidyl-2-C-methyl-D-erythritol kinase